MTKGYVLSATYLASSGDAFVYAMRTSEYMSIIHILEGDDLQYKWTIVTDNEYVSEEGELTATES